MKNWFEDVNDDGEKFPLSEESASQSVRELLDFYDIEGSSLPEDARKSLNRALGIIVKGYRSGVLENKRNDDGGLEVVQKVKNGRDSVTYREVSAKEKRVMDNYEPTAFYARQQALMGKLSGLGTDVIGNFRREDAKYMEALSLFFFCV